MNMQNFTLCERNSAGLNVRFLMIMQCPLTRQHSQGDLHLVLLLLDPSKNPLREGGSTPSGF